MRRSVSKMFVSFLPAVTVAIEATGARAIRATADIGRNQTVENLSGGRSGPTYRVPGTSVMYTASAPGEFPAVQTGRLKGSVRILPSGGDLLIGTDVEYGLYLEKGGGGGRDTSGRFTAGMKRPWLKRSLDQAKPAMILELNKRWF